MNEDKGYIVPFKRIEKIVPFVIINKNLDLDKSRWEVESLDENEEIKEHSEALEEIPRCDMGDMLDIDTCNCKENYDSGIQELNLNTVKTKNIPMEMIAVSDIIFDGYQKIWMQKTSLATSKTSKTIVNKKRFLEREDGVFLEKNDGSLLQLSNFSVRPIGVICQYKNNLGEFEEYIKYEICYKDWMKNKEIILEKEKHNTVHSLVRKKYPELIIMKPNSNNYFEIYLAERYQEAQSDLTNEEFFCFSGWFLKSGRHEYMNALKENCFSKKKLSNLNGLDNYSVLKNGFDFINVGHSKKDIVVPFLFAHCGFLFDLFKEAGFTWTSVLYINGMSGSLKTSVSRALFNLFESDKNKQVVNFEGSEAGITTKMLNTVDDIVIIDDLSKSVASKNKKQAEIFEKVIRIIGDGISNVKMRSDRKDIVQPEVRCCVVVTGEDLQLGSQSSQLRVIHVPVNKESYNGAILEIFQRNSSFMKNYFSLFIAFLETNYESVVMLIRNRFTSFRCKYKDTFEFGRTNDTTAQLLIIVEILDWFIKWADCPSFRSCLDEFSNIVLETMKTNERKKRNMDIHKMYIWALYQQLSVKIDAAVAKNFEEYADKAEDFIGFRDPIKRILWLKYETAYELVRKYWIKQEKEYTVSIEKMHKILSDLNISVCNKGQNLKRLTKNLNGKRPYMLVLSEDKIEEIVKEVMSEGDVDNE